MKIFVDSPASLAAGGQRAAETRDRVAGRVMRVIQAYVDTALVDRADVADVVVTIGSNESAIETRPADWALTRRIGYNSSWPGTAARLVGDALHEFIADRLFDVIAEQRQATGRLFADIERLTADLSDALDENDDLRRQLADARIEVDFLRRTVDLLSESVRTNRPTLVKRVMLVVSGVLLAAATGAAEAGTSTILKNSNSDPAQEYVIRCEVIQGQLDQIILNTDSFPTA